MDKICYNKYGDKMEKELEYLEYWYRTFFKCRITHRTVPRDFACYIFANRKDMERYCIENNLKYDKYVYPDYFLLNEENIGNIIGCRINKVHLISSSVPRLVQNICMEAMQEGYNIEFTSKNLL